MELFTKPNDPEKCLLKDTRECKAMNNPPCPACQIGKLSEERQKEVIEDYAVVLDLLPEDGVAPFYESEECLLCREEPRRKREYYGIVDFAHKEPQRTKSSAIGIRVKTRIGSFVPVQIATCARCRRNIILTEYLQWVILVLAGAIGLWVISIDAVREPLIGINALLPLGLFVVYIALMALLCHFIVSSIFKAKSKETIMDINELERIKALREKGWFSLSDDKKHVRLLFTKKPLKHGWFTLSSDREAGLE